MNTVRLSNKAFILVTFGEKLVWDWLLFKLTHSYPTHFTGKEIYFKFDPPTNEKKTFAQDMNLMKRTNKIRGGTGVVETFIFAEYLFKSHSSFAWVKRKLKFHISSEIHAWWLRFVYFSFQLRTSLDGKYNETLVFSLFGARGFVVCWRGCVNIYKKGK